MFRQSSRSYYPSTPAQRAQVSYGLPFVCLVPILMLVYAGYEDVERKSKALKLTVSGGEGWTPERRKVRASREKEKTAEE